MRILPIFLKIIFLALISSLIFLITKSIFEYLYVNWISSKPAWPDQRSIYSLIRFGSFQTTIYFIAFLIGCFITWTNITRLSNLNSLILIIVCGLIGTTYALIFSNIEFKSGEISFGVALFWPILILVSVVAFSRILEKI